MDDRQIVITQNDADRLRQLIDALDDLSGRSDLTALLAELDRSTIVAPEDIPPDVVTMNSTVVLHEIERDQEKTISLVFPADADIDAGAISVLAPVGTAILGFKKGDVVEWPVPAGLRRFRIEKILYQPEAAGDMDR
ncbi:MAG: nucleoside diphosphate kinase regulator [Actinobacteria bacterium]|nr:nucleoside diphosphate kinase regulator [Actinomycetota bacterium]